MVIFLPELHDLQTDIVDLMIVGNSIIHHCKWLRYSNGNTIQEHVLQDVCADFKLKGWVREPTRGQCLSDFFWTILKHAKSRLYFTSLITECYQFLWLYPFRRRQSLRGRFGISKGRIENYWNMIFLVLVGPRYGKETWSQLSIYFMTFWRIHVANIFRVNLLKKEQTYPWI